MATRSFFIVCFLIKSSFAIGIFHFHSKDYNTIDKIRPENPTQFIFTNSTNNSSSFSPPEIHSVSSRNMTVNVISPRSYPDKITMSVHSRFVFTNMSTSSPSSKRQRRGVTIPLIQHRRSPVVRTDIDRKHFQTVPNRRRPILAEGHFQQSRRIAARNNWPRVSGLPVNHRIPIPQIPVRNSEPEMIKPFPALRIILPESNPRPNGIRLNPGQSGSWNIFLPNPRLEINPEPESGRIRPNPEPGRIRPNPEPGRMRSNPEPGRMRPNPEPGRMRPNPEPGRMRPNPEPGKIRPNPEPGRIRPNPEPGRMRPNPEPGKIRPNPEPGRMRPNPEPGRMRPNPEPERMRPNPEPGKIRPNPEPGRMRPNPEPGRMRPNPEPERMRPNPEPGRMRPQPEPGRMRPQPEPGRIIPDPEPGRIIPSPELGTKVETGGMMPNANPRLPNVESGRSGARFKSLPEEVEESDLIPSDSFKLPPRQTDNNFSNGHQFPLKKNLQVQFPQIDWSGPIPWPRQERRHDLQKIQYPLFPWWQKRIWTPSDRSDHPSNGGNIGNQKNQTIIEDASDGSNGENSKRGDLNRGDTDVPNSCVALTANGDCNFYRCFDQQHTCPVDQNFAYNVAFYLCKRIDNYLNFFEDQAKKYLGGVKRCQMEALVPIYKTEVPTCSQIEAVGLDILTGGILPPSVNDVSCFFQNGAFCDVMEDPQNVQLLYDLYGGDGYTEYRVFIHFVKLIQKCSPVALESFNQRYAQRFMRFQD